MPTRILLGSGRSGTTWIQDCLAKANDLRPIFEPLHPLESDLGSRCAYRVRTRESIDEMLEAYLRNPDFRIVPKRWVVYRVPIRVLLPRLSRFSEKGFWRLWLRTWHTYGMSCLRAGNTLEDKGVLIKCIRGNLMAGWLASQQNCIVALTVRHPCAVVESKNRLGMVWNPYPLIDKYRNDVELNTLTDGRYESILNQKLTPIEAHCLNWVIENQWPAENSKNAGYPVIFYEDLLGESQDGWAKLCEAMQLENIPAQDLIARPSQQSSKHGPGIARDHEKPTWRRRLDRVQLNEIQGILDKTNCQLYSVEEVVPSE